MESSAYINIPQYIPPQQSCRAILSYSSPRYQCNINFYQKLLKQISLLQIWSLYQNLQPIYQKVKQLFQLTKMHALINIQNSQKEARILSQKINNAMINLEQAHLNIQKQGKGIHYSIKIANSLQGKCLSRMVLNNLLSNQQDQDSKQYFEEILVRIWSTTNHNPRLRSENIWMVGIFGLVNNGQKQVRKMVEWYKNVMQKSLVQLKRFKQRCEEVLVMDEELKIQIIQSEKFKIYLAGIIKIFHLSLKMSQILKLLQAKSTFKLKLNSTRKQIIHIFTLLQKYTSIQHSSLIQDKFPQKNILTLFQNYLISPNSSIQSYLKSNICAFCLKSGKIYKAKNHKNMHIDCWNWLRSIMKVKT